MKEENITQRLNSLIDKIEDVQVRDVVREVIDVEIQNRSLNYERFPLKKLRQIIDNSVAKQNLNSKKG